ncbi:double zinc ribbon domain-containing protein [Halorussus marinus]|uniref:double zinc ribbon domain-containing protein n=1 Tax=Halorussus marinus TaxID=2505976 RepID=UPI001092E421|nr:zinc ribbon domain-containing protein [Halorussus marinus]
MSKITFRADEDLIERIEALDESKSEVMREALRAYLDAESEASGGAEESLDGLLAERVDELVATRLDAREPEARSSVRPQGGRDVNVNVTLESDGAVRERAADESARDGDTTDDRDRQSERDCECGQCGESLSDDHVYCPNCGEKASRRAFCECGDEVRSDWAFCPGCGRRTPAADVLDRT